MILKYPVATEKAIRIIEAENKMTFVVELNANVGEIKKSFEEMFKAKVEKVNTLRRGSKKIAYIRLSPETPAVDIATRLGLM